MNISPNQLTIQEQATAWWVRLDNGDVSREERAAFLHWQNAHPAHRAAFAEVCQLWGELDALKPQLAAAPKPIPSTEKKTLWQWRYGVGFLATACLLLLLFNPLAILFRADFTTGIGETRQITLADGSMVYLNSDSALAVKLTPSLRQLNLLKGEALFMVSPDRARPFSVQAGQGSTTALGTAFNIRHLTAGAEITVTEHSVAVAVNAGSPTIVSEGQRLSYADATGISLPTKADVHSATAWQRGKLVFQNQPLGEVISELNRYHHGLLRITDAGIADRRVNGVFNIDQPMTVINTLEKSLHLHSTRLTDYLVLLHR
ncbi:MAG: FecR family protein [Methylococcales bacterium]